MDPGVKDHEWLQSWRNANDSMKAATHLKNTPGEDRVLRTQPSRASFLRYLASSASSWRGLMSILPRVLTKHPSRSDSPTPAQGCTSPLSASVVTACSFAGLHGVRRNPFSESVFFMLHKATFHSFSFSLSLSHLLSFDQPLVPYPLEHACRASGAHFEVA